MLRKLKTQFFGIKSQLRHHHLTIHQYQKHHVQQKVLPIAQFYLLNTNNDKASSFTITLEAFQLHEWINQVVVAHRTTTRGKIIKVEADVILSEKIWKVEQIQAH